MTAVKWLVEQMIYQMDIRIENTTIGCELFEQAKQMMKEQIIAARANGDEDYSLEKRKEFAEQYYNEKYEK